MSATPLTSPKTLSTAPSRVRSVVDGVAKWIREGRLRVGDDLPSELSFAAQFGVSRSVVREAFGALAALNIIEVANGRRPRVSATDGSSLALSLDHALSTDQVSVQEVWEVRRCLETQTATLAAIRRSEEEAARILECVRAMQSQAAGSPEMVRLDIEFHTLIAASSRNMLMAQIIGSFTHLMDAAVPAAWSTRRTEEDRIQVLQWHMEIANAIGRRDADAARAAMDHHFSRDISAMLDSRYRG